jgi:NADPH-dependent curcumin reductase CurA
VQGFIVLTLVPKYAAEFYATIPVQAAKGELKWQEHVYRGLDGTHQALLDVQTGKNNGKAVVVLDDA